MLQDRETVVDRQEWSKEERRSGNEREARQGVPFVT